MTAPSLPLVFPNAPAGPAREASLERARLAVVLFTVFLNVVAVTAFTFLPGSDWRTAIGLNVADNAILVAFAWRRRDRLMGNLLLFGLAVGVMELPTDAWIVDVTQTLDYSPGGGPMIWRSPFWMPLAWQVVAVQFGYIGLRLFERFKFPGLLLAGLVGAVNIPFYEEMALRTHWWRYHDCAMFLHTPYAIIVGEFFIAGYLGFFARRTRCGCPRRSLAAGIMGGASIFVGYALPYWAITRLNA